MSVVKTKFGDFNTGDAVVVSVTKNLSQFAFQKTNFDGTLVGDKIRMGKQYIVIQEAGKNYEIPVLSDIEYIAAKNASVATKSAPVAEKN